jgi:hypothetical protein
MNDRTQNHLNMIGAVLNVARNPEFLPVWQNQPPVDFTQDLLQLEADFGAASAKAANIAGAPTGTADQKDVLETTLENTLHTLCRALAIHFKKTGDLSARAEVHLSPTAIQRLRDRALIALAERTLTLANTAATHPDAPKRNITPARIATLQGALDAYEAAVNTPRGNIVNRSTIRRELATDVAALLDLTTDLDDLILQLEPSDLTTRFQSAWKQARIILDAGHSPTDEDEPQPNPTPTQPNP